VVRLDPAGRDEWTPHDLFVAVTRHKGDCFDARNIFGKRWTLKLERCKGVLEVLPVRLAAAAQKEKKKRRVVELHGSTSTKCSKGHALTLEIGNGGPQQLTCDGPCGLPLLPAALRLSCAECDEDCCLDCSQRLATCGLKRRRGSDLTTPPPPLCPTVSSLMDLNDEEVEADEEAARAAAEAEGCSDEVRRLGQGAGTVAVTGQLAEEVGEDTVPPSAVAPHEAEEVTAAPAIKLAAFEETTSPMEVPACTAARESAAAGMSAVRALLARANLAEYATTFEDLGYDHLGTLEQLNRNNLLQEIAMSELGMKPGHYKRLSLQLNSEMH